MKQKPIVEVWRRPQVAEVLRRPQDVIRFLIETGESSLEEVTFKLPEREALQQAVQKLGPRTEFLISIIEGSGLPEHVRQLAMQNLSIALACAFTIGADGTRSRNTKAVGTAAGRRERAEKRAPADQRIWDAITEAAKSCPLPPSRRGRLTWIDQEAAHKLDMKVTTVTSHRKKMLIV